MLKRAIIPLGILVLLTACASKGQSSPVVIQGTTVPPVPTLDAALVEDGKILYDAYCADCHREALDGQPDWKIRKEDGSFPAPPHDSSGHTWHHPDEVILAITAQGGDQSLGSKMPAFGNTLSEDQMVAVLTYIKSYWGDEERSFQWWITAR